MDWIFPLIGGLGIGSLLKGFVDHFLSNKTKNDERLYSEKREAYLGLLSALHEAAVHPSDKNAKAYALWQTRCCLFASEQVIELAQEIVDTNDGPRSERKKAYDTLLEAMRNDLKRE